MEQYRTEEEQVEALRKWWDENGRSTIAAVIIALAAGFGWQGWTKHQQNQAEAASDAYQALLQQLGGDTAAARSQAGMLKTEFARTTYAQFAALHLARLAVDQGDLAGAEAELRWVLGRADAGSDVAQVAQLRLARVLAAAGNGEQALGILDKADAGAYQAAYAMARGDILLQLGRDSEAGETYASARLLAAREGAPVNLPTLEQKIQSLNPVPARELDAAAAAATEGAAVLESVAEQE